MKEEVPALLGGSPVREKPVPWVSDVGAEEEAAVVKVMRSGMLSAEYFSA
jgi:hypothetical protein